MNPQAEHRGPRPGVTLDMGRVLIGLLFVLLLGQTIYRVAHRAEAHRAAQAACSAVDDRGKQVTLPAPPNRIVSLIPAATEMLYALKLDGHVVADTAYCDYPPAARALPKVGDVSTSTEKVVAQRPDLVVSSASGNSKALPAIEGAGVKVFAVDPNTLDQTYSAITRLGAVTGRTAEAADVVTRMKASAARVSNQVKAAPDRPRVLFVLQAKPLWVVGGGNFIDETIAIAGGVNVAHGVGKGFTMLSAERAIAMRPDVIFVNAEDAKALRTFPAWSTVPAVRNGRIYTLDPAIVTRPGPRLAVAAELMAKSLHPRLFAART